MSEPQIRDALRQLGQAVGTLVRAVLGAVRRRRPAAAAPTDGPPQAWLDFVAETDPEWLARSRWADRAGGDRTAHERRRARREVPSEQAPRRSPLVVPGPAGEGRPSWTRERANASQPQADEPETEVTAPSVTPAVPQPPRLLPAEPAPAQPEHPAAHRRARLAGPLESRSARHEEPVSQPLSREPEAPRRAPDASRPLPFEPGRGEPGSAPSATPRRLVNPPRATVTELPGTWVPKEAPRHVPTPPTGASQPAWPDLPATAGLDDTEPGPGLAAVLWDLDGGPDPLTTAQRRS